MKSEIGKIVLKGLVGGALVAAPAFGGQFVSAVAKAKVPGADKIPDAVVDGASCVAVGAVETGIAYLAAGKRTAAKVAALAAVGVVIGTALPLVDDAIDSAVRSVIGAPAAPALAPVASPAAQLAGARQPLRLAKAGGVDINRGIGGAVPGGVDAVVKTGGVLW